MLTAYKEVQNTLLWSISSTLGGLALRHVLKIFTEINSDKVFLYVWRFFGRHSNEVIQQVKESPQLRGVRPWLFVTQNSRGWLGLQGLTEEGDVKVEDALKGH